MATFRPSSEHKLYETLRPENVDKLYKGDLPEDIEKAGILPYHHTRSGEIKFLLMKPRAKMGFSTPPSFQLAKGARYAFANDEWNDMGRSASLFDEYKKFEPYLEAALREGQEELGLKCANIKRMSAMGAFDTVSERNGETSTFVMYAAEVKNERDFRKPESSTSAVCWATGKEMEGVVRADHLKCIREMEQALLALPRQAKAIGGR